MIKSLFVFNLEEQKKAGNKIPTPEILLFYIFLLHFLHAKSKEH